ncbi:MAG: putative inorganic carbon transporter subunit DabA, partial [Hoeflea sp.]|nr:putative inorganic carbon transporter subunit DabA [Hoeflea sp.]
EPVAASPDQVMDAILQDAAERAHQRRLEAMLTGTEPGVAGARPALQAAFCIDVRSEVFRRALESADAGIATLGFAGFFGLPVAHRSFGSDVVEAHLPVLLNPGLASHGAGTPEVEQAARITARTARAWGRFRQAAVSSFAFVEAAGPVYGWKLAKDALGLRGKGHGADPAPQLDLALTPAQKSTNGAAVLKAMSLTAGHARLVLLLGHGGQVANNPHESAYHCGACGGYTGEVSSRLLAALLNDPETRAGLPGHGIDLAPDTLFVAGLHNTTTDDITLYPDSPAPDLAADQAQAWRWLAAAGGLARAERALRLPGATAATIAARAANWAEVRPEWGLAGCAAFIAAPRGATRHADLGGRAFLHCYDWQADAGFGTLELILTAPVVVASWIGLQYYGSAVAPNAFGGGNKLIHNVTGGIGVIEGNGGMLRSGLPWQAVHDGAGLAHDPLRLSVMIEAPQAAIADVLARHDGLRALFDNGWLHLFALESGRIAARYRPGLAWQSQANTRQAA